MLSPTIVIQRCKICFHHIACVHWHPTTTHAFVQNKQSSNFLPFGCGFAHVLHMYTFIQKKKFYNLIRDTFLSILNSPVQLSPLWRWCGKWVKGMWGETWCRFENNHCSFKEYPDSETWFRKQTSGTQREQHMLWSHKTWSLSPQRRMRNESETGGDNIETTREQRTITHKPKKTD